MSSTKRVLKPYQIISAQSMASNIASAETNTQFLDYCFFQVDWTGTSPVGTFNIEYLKIEAQRNTSTGVDVWEKLDFGGTTGTDLPVSGNTGTIQIIMNDIVFPKLRCNYARTSGVGTLTATLIAKEK